MPGEHWTIDLDLHPGAVLKAAANKPFDQIKIGDIRYRRRVELADTVTITKAGRRRILKARDGRTG